MGGGEPRPYHIVCHGIMGGGKPRPYGRWACRIAYCVDHCGVGAALAGALFYAIGVYGGGEWAGVNPASKITVTFEIKTSPRPLRSFETFAFRF